MPTPTAPSQPTGLLGPITWGVDFNYFNKITVSSNAFNPYADVFIPFTTAGIQLINFGSGTTNVIEFSLNGLTTHGELYPLTTSNSSPTTFLNRVVCKMWFRVQSGSSGSIVVSVNAWATH